MSPEVLIAATGLVSVALSAAIALLSLIANNRLQERSYSREVGLSLLPRRQEAFEFAWQAAFEVESTGSLSPQRQDELIAKLLWLPETLREPVLSMLVSPSGCD